jgi:adenylylsulfate kinase
MKTEHKSSPNVFLQQAKITRAMKEDKNGHRGAVIWFTGLSGSGKSTLAHALEERLFLRGVRTYVLDGDNVRHGLCSDLGFSNDDRRENIRRIGETAKLMAEASLIVLTAFISPFREDRERVRGLMPHGDFLEIYVKCPLDVCESRDVKGLYKRARAGEIKGYTGIDSPYEEPERPDLIIDTSLNPLESELDQLIALLAAKGLIAK